MAQSDKIPRERITVIATPRTAYGPRPSSHSPGETRIVNGQTEIFVGAYWVKYPSKADEVIRYAHEHGWGVDDGLPPKMEYSSGDPYIRILIGREFGYVDGEYSPAIQFHIMWRPNARSFGMAEIYMKTSDDYRWSDVETLFAVKRIIGKYPVDDPSEFVSEYR